MENKYEDLFIKNASKLDAITDSRGKITNSALLIVNENDSIELKKIIKKIRQSIKDEETSKEVKEFSKILYNNLLSFYGEKEIKKILNFENINQNEEKTLEELLEELNSMIGLETVKSKVDDLISFQKVQRFREENNLYTPINTFHMAFTGNPGTGKTSVARIIGRIYKKLGLLSTGNFYEVSRTDLIAGYQGQTALKVKSVINKAKGGVLFIDEAYSLTENNQSDSYGRECLTELTKALEDYRDDLVVIVAGYTEPMNNFFDSNQGLKSRFNHFIEFPDYNSEELMKILMLTCEKSDYNLDDLVTMKIKDSFNEKITNKTTNFSNARLVRNVYDDLVLNHARRISKINNPTMQDLTYIRSEDYIVK